MKAICVKSWDGLGEVGKEYLITGIFLGETNNYLIDQHEFAMLLPTELFTVTDHTIPPCWFFKQHLPQDQRYCYTSIIWGYYEFCFDENHYSKLLIEHDKTSILLYHERKREIEKSLQEWHAFSHVDEEQQQNSKKNYSVIMSEGKMLGFLRRNIVAEISDLGCLIAAVAYNFHDKTFDVEMYPPTRGTSGLPH